jgi:Histidine phosphatase superfamily (branch 1)
LSETTGIASDHSDGGHIDSGSGISTAVRKHIVPKLCRQQLLLARHGETADNAAHLILGRRDPSLSDVGREQATVLAGAARDAGVAGVWTSPLERARRSCPA